MRGIKLSVSPAFVLCLCAFCWLDGLGLFWPFTLAAALHEGGHLLALRIMHIPVRELRLGVTGAVIRAELTGAKRELPVVLAGPAVNLLCALLSARWLPAFCLCNTLLFFYNMLPVYPLDGGRLCRLLLPRKVCAVLQSAVILLAAAAGVWGTCVLHLGLLPCLAAAFFLLRLPKTSCKTPERLIKYIKKLWRSP